MSIIESFTSLTSSNPLIAIVLLVCGILLCSWIISAAVSAILIAAAGYGILYLISLAKVLYDYHTDPVYRRCVETGVWSW